MRIDLGDDSHDHLITHEHRMAAAMVRPEATNVSESAARTNANSCQFVSWLERRGFDRMNAGGSHLEGNDSNGRAVVDRAHTSTHRGLDTHHDGRRGLRDEGHRRHARPRPCATWFEVETKRALTEWSFLTNHARVLICIAGDPDVRLREVAAMVDITERNAYQLVTDLVAAGYVAKERDGRRNRTTSWSTDTCVSPRRRNAPSASFSTSSSAVRRPRARPAAGARASRRVTAYCSLALAAV